jgi:hypothetical protein
MNGKRMFKRLFLDHPRSVGETYFEHQRNALGYAVSMFAGGTAYVLHSLMPGTFVTTGSRTIRKLYDRMLQNRKSNSERSIFIETWDI